MIAPDDGAPVRRACDFCGVGPDDTKVMYMMSPNAAICWRCVEVARVMLSEWSLVPDLKITYRNQGEPEKP